MEQLGSKGTMSLQDGPDSAENSHMRAATSFVRTVASVASRARHLVLIGWGILWLLPPSHYTLGMLNDWLPFEIGARTLVHYHHMFAFQTPFLHLYAESPQLQFGPLPMLLLAPFQALSPHGVAIGFGVAMIAAGVASMAVIIDTARVLAPESARTTITRTGLALQVALVPIWSYEVGYWHHLDDVIALLCLSITIRLLARGGPWWACAMLVGTAAATKPWAVIALPLLLVLPRPTWLRTACLALISAVAWWAPFLIAAPDTLTAIGHYQTVPLAGSPLYLIGQHSDGANWLRQLQFVAGIGVVAFVVLRRRWQDALLAGMAVRIILDPYSYSYYALAPLLGAMLVDLSRGSRIRVPRWTLTTLALVWVLPRLTTHIPLWGHTFARPIHADTESAIVLIAWCALVLWRMTARERATAVATDDQSSSSSRDERVSTVGAPTVTTTVSSMRTPPLPGR
jgi:hypothetical protein